MEGPHVPPIRKEAAMRVFGVALGIAVVVLLVGVSMFSQAQAQRPVSQAERGQPGELLALSMDVEGRQQVTVVDPRRQVLAVYHIDRNTGAISLRSVRNVQWDLVMEDFNSGAPTPREIRSIADQR
jgi:hypothetical protein